MLQARIYLLPMLHNFINWQSLNEKFLNFSAPGILRIRLKNLQNALFTGREQKHKPDYVQSSAKVKKCMECQVSATVGHDQGV